MKSYRMARVRDIPGSEWQSDRRAICGVAGCSELDACGSKCLARRFGIGIRVNPGEEFLFSRADCRPLNPSPRRTVAGIRRSAPKTPYGFQVIPHTRGLRLRC